MPFSFKADLRIFLIFKLIATVIHAHIPNDIYGKVIFFFKIQRLPVLVP